MLAHRHFFHRSLTPPSSSSTTTTATQALHDLAEFHGYATGVNNEWGLGASNKWVSFGGSYPGMLAGWVRLKFPELIHAGVASSAPVHAKLDMNEYNDVTAEVRHYRRRPSPPSSLPSPPLSPSPLSYGLCLSACAGDEITHD